MVSHAQKAFNHRSDLDIGMDFLEVYVLFSRLTNEQKREILTEINSGCSSNHLASCRAGFEHVSVPSVPQVDEDKHS